MEEKKNSRAHCISWNNRQKGSVTGVKDVYSFDEDTVVLETEQGRMTIKGKHLHIGRLLLEQGEAELEGQVDSIVYSGNADKNSSLVRRLFR